MLTVCAYAKINLTLEILGRLDDGYHQIASVMQLIGLHDTLSFKTAEDVRLACNIPELCSPDNLVFKAARLLQETANIKRGALINIQKNIPLDSGLGGGSSDAAATLRALNQLWETNLPIGEIRALSSKLGSDVAFFLEGGTSLVTGRGEIVSPLPPLLELWVVLLKPPINVSQKTRTMYAHLERKNWTSGLLTQRMATSLKHNEEIDLSLCYNVFEEVASLCFPGLDRYRQAFQDAGAVSVHLAGAGPTLFALMNSKEKAEEIRSRLDSEVYLTQTLQMLPNEMARNSQ